MSIYWVLCWAYHRHCRHRYASRPHRHIRDSLAAVAAGCNAPRVITYLSPHMSNLDRTDPALDGMLREKTGRIVLPGGESLRGGVRQRVVYQVIEGVVARYAGADGTNALVQTTVDLLTPEIVAEPLAGGIWMVSSAGIDDIHVGLDGQARQAAYQAWPMLADLDRPEGLPRWPALSA